MRTRITTNPPKQEFVLQARLDWLFNHDVFFGDFNLPLEKLMKVSWYSHRRGWFMYRQPVQEVILDSRQELLNFSSKIFLTSDQSWDFSVSLLIAFPRLWRAAICEVTPIPELDEINLMVAGDRSASISTEPRRSLCQVSTVFRSGSDELC